MTEILIGKIQGNSSPRFSSLRYYVSLLQSEQRTLVSEPGIIRIQMGTYNRSENGRRAWGSSYDTTP
jgi:hypothetical protein